MAERSNQQLDREQSTVVIVGTLHLKSEEYPAYAERLGKIIEEISPDVICAELSPEQLAGTQSCNSKPEERDVVIPTARRLQIPIVPIQPPTAEALDWENRFKAIDHELRSDDSNRRLFEFADRLAREECELWRNRMKAANCIEHLQLNEYDVFPEARDKVETQLLPSRAELFREWNEHFLRPIEHAVDNNPGRRILVLFGLWHKYWLWNKLQSRQDVTVHNLQSYRQSLRVAGSQSSEGMAE